MLLQLFPQTVRHPTAPATAISHATVIHADHVLLQACDEYDSSESQEAVIRQCNAAGAVADCLKDMPSTKHAVCASTDAW